MIPTCPLCNTKIYKYTTITGNKYHPEPYQIFTCDNNVYYYHDEIDGSHKESEYTIFIINDIILRECFYITNYHITVDYNEFLWTSPPKTSVFLIEPIKNIRMVCYGDQPIEEEFTDIALTEALSFDQIDIFHGSQDEMEKKINLYLTFK